MNKSIYEIEGFDELQRKIKSLPDKVKKKEVNKILRKAAKSTVDAARAFAPKRTQNLSKSIKVATMTRAKVPMVVVGPRSKGKYDGWYGRQFVIPGHNIYKAGFSRNRKGNKKYNDANAAGKVAANPFMEKAFNATGGLVSQKAVASTEKYIQKQIDRL